MKNSAILSPAMSALFPGIPHFYSHLMLFYFYKCKPKNFFSFKLGRSGDKATAMLQFIFVSAVAS